jgi:uncharacterized protein YdeI (BOF family)
MQIDNESSSPAATAPAAPKTLAPRRTAVITIAAMAILAVGAAAGAAGMKLTRPSVEMAPLTPVAITSLTDSSRNVVTVKGKVVEIYGNKFIVQDDSGRALVESGPAGDGGKLVGFNEELNVQGRFDKGFLHASYIVHQDGRTEMLRPAGPPPPHKQHGGPMEDGPKQPKP